MLPICNSVAAPGTSLLPTTARAPTMCDLEQGAGHALVEAASAVGIKSGNFDAADGAVRALFRNPNFRSAHWEEAALVLFRRLRAGGYDLTRLLRADQVQHQALTLHGDLVCFLLRFGPKAAIVAQLRGHSDGARIETLIRKGVGRPYLSRKGNPAIQLNGCAHFEDRRYLVPIVCDHLSWMYLGSVQRSPSGRKPHWDGFKTRESLTASAPPGLRKADPVWRDCVAMTHILTNAEFGVFLLLQLEGLKAAFDRLSTDDDRARGATSLHLVITTGHRMGLSLTVKQSPDGPLHVVRVYDPDLTATQMRACNLDPDAYAEHRYSDYLIADVMFDPLRRSQSSVNPYSCLDGLAGNTLGDDATGDDAIITIHTARIGEPPPDHRDFDLSPGIKPGATVAWHLMVSGAADLLRTMLAQAFQESAQMPDPAARIDTILRATNYSLNRPGLFSALQFGHVGVVAVVSEAILSSGLPAGDKIALLKAKDDVGTQGLYWALSNGHTDTVVAFTNAVLDSDLPDADKFGLLDTTNRSGSGLHWAAADGHAETARAFRDAVSRSGLPDSMKAALTPPQSTAPDA